MPKVSRVGKFRKAAKTVAAETLNKPAAAAAADEEQATASKDHHGDRPTKVATASNDNPPKNGKDDAQKPSTSGDASSSKQQQQQGQPQQLTLSRGQRKRLAKRDQYLKREQMVLSSLELKRQDEQKKRIDGLDAMKSALLETIHSLHASKQQGEDTEDSAKSSVIKTNKARQRLVGTEVAQMSLVLQHPSFQADPFATIREHLKNTIPPPAASATLDHRKAKREEKRAIKKIKSEDDVKQRKHHNKKRARPTRSKAR
jgi:Ribosome biogenesis protein SLX9